MKMLHVIGRHIIYIIFAALLLYHNRETYRTFWGTSCIFEGRQFPFRGTSSRSGRVNTVWRSPWACWTNSPAYAWARSALVVGGFRATTRRALKNRIYKWRQSQRCSEPKLENVVKEIRKIVTYITTSIWWASSSCSSFGSCFSTMWGRSGTYSTGCSTCTRPTGAHSILGCTCCAIWIRAALLIQNEKKHCKNSTKLFLW